MDDGADGDGAGEEGCVVGQGDRQRDQVRQFIGGVDGFGSMDMERTDGVDIFFRPGAGCRLLNGRKDEIGPRPVEVDECAYESRASVS